MHGLDQRYRESVENDIRASGIRVDVILAHPGRRQCSQFIPWSLSNSTSKIMYRYSIFNIGNGHTHKAGYYLSLAYPTASPLVHQQHLSYTAPVLYIVKTHLCWPRSIYGIGPMLASAGNIHEIAIQPTRITNRIKLLLDHARIGPATTRWWILSLERIQ